MCGLSRLTSARASIARSWNGEEQDFGWTPDAILLGMALRSAGHLSPPVAGSKQSAHHRLMTLRVTGGFLGGIELDFADGLNCLIGGRGAGKTTVLEFLRFGLGLMPDAKANPHRHRAIEGLVKANLGNGRISITLLTKAEMSYTAGRSATEAIQVLNEMGTAVPVSLDRDQIFGADVFSQNEIEEIALSPAAQLELLDTFQEQEAVEIARNLEHLQRQLDQSGRDLSRLDEEIDDLRGKASELAGIEERLKGLAEVAGPDATRINAAHAAKTSRAREEKVPELLGLALEKATREIAGSEAAFQGTVDAQLDLSILEGANRDIFGLIDGEVRAFGDVLSTVSKSVTEAMMRAADRIRNHQAILAEHHALQEAEYRTTVAESEEQGGRAVERLTLQTALANAQSAVNEQNSRLKQREALVKDRNGLLKRMSELRDQRFALRKQVAERLTRELVGIRVTVAQAAELQQYSNLIAESLKGAGMKHGLVADRLSQHFLPTELAKAVGESDYATVMQRINVDEERANRIIHALRSGAASYAIETVDLEDRPCIELLDGDKYKESPHLSTGQRCTTILPILLIQSERPLLIDQPEDNLDNAFVYDTIVKALKTVKGHRQIIFVTHNPNIPVLGDADRVFVFASDGLHATLRQVGTVDECKDQIEKILEGGSEAFLQRKARYGH